jgi:hypothetical protein
VATTINDLSRLSQGRMRPELMSRRGYAVSAWTVTDTSLGRGIGYPIVERFTDRSGPYGPLIFAPAHHGAGGKELLKLMLTWTCSNAAVSGARSSSGSGSKNIRRTKAT